MNVSKGLTEDAMGEVESFWSAIAGESCVSIGREDSSFLKGTSS
jgi:hypothetical protein